MYKEKTNAVNGLEGGGGAGGHMGAKSPKHSPILFPPKPYLVPRDTLRSCEAYGMRPMYQEKNESGGENVCKGVVDAPTPSPSVSR
jgi:hypothetical protein